MRLKAATQIRQIKRSLRCAVVISAVVPGEEGGGTWAGAENELGGGFSGIGLVFRKRRERRDT